MKIVYVNHNYHNNLIHSKSTMQLPIEAVVNRTPWWTLLIKKQRPPLYDPRHRPAVGSQGGGCFLMSEVTLYHAAAGRGHGEEDVAARDQPLVQTIIQHSKCVVF